MAEGGGSEENPLCEVHLLADELKFKISAIADTLYVRKIISEVQHSQLKAEVNPVAARNYFFLDVLQQKTPKDLHQVARFFQVSKMLKLKTKLLFSSLRKNL